MTEKPSYDELVYALKDTYKLYLESMKNNTPFSHDITRIIANENLLLKLNEQTNK